MREVSVCERQCEYDDNRVSCEESPSDRSFFTFVYPMTCHHILHEKKTQSWMGWVGCGSITTSAITTIKQKQIRYVGQNCWIIR